MREMYPVGGLALVIPAICVAGSEPTLRLWDTRELHTQKHYDFRPYKNRSQWQQVPYGTTDYQFQGSPVVENEFFYIYFHASRYDCIFLYAKRDGKPMWANELYKVHVVEGKHYSRGKWHYGHGTKYVKILRNSPEEIIVEHQAESYPVTTTYRILKGKPWFEVRAVERASEQGIHGKVRMALAPVEGGNDFVVDSLRDPAGRIKAPPTKMLLCFYENREFPFMWVLTWTAPFEQAEPWFLNDSGPKGDTMWAAPGEWGGLLIPRRWQGCITSTWVSFGQRGSVVVGALAYPNTWHREQVDKPIRKGEVYTAKWKPPYPGHWRMTVRIAEKRYDQGFNYDGKTKFPAKYFTKDVYDGKFTFRSPKDGWLDYIIMYLYDRTEQTPADILTPMDQYRWTVRQKERE